MAIDTARRTLMIAGGLLAAGVRPACLSAATAWRSPSDAAFGEAWPALLGAWESRGVNYAGVWSQAKSARGIPLPFRAHEVLPDPLHPGQAVVIARRPGDFILRFDARRLKTVLLRDAGPERVFNGHAAFSADAKTLFTSESNIADGQGVIGVRDAATLEKQAEFATHGIGPHAILLEPGGALLVANGAILTLPETGRIKLNTGQMDPSIARLDASSGRLLGQWRLPDPQLSIRHLSRAANGTVGIALQAEHADSDLRRNSPLLACFDGGTLCLAERPPEIVLGGYGGDVAYLEGNQGGYFAVSCTPAGLVAWWDAAGRWQGATSLAGACAMTEYAHTLIACTESGALARLTALTSYFTPLTCLCAGLKPSFRH